MQKFQYAPEPRTRQHGKLLKDGEDYERNSLRVIITAVDRYLTEKE